MEAAGCRSSSRPLTQVGSAWAWGWGWSMGGGAGEGEEGEVRREGENGSTAESGNRRGEPEAQQGQRCQQGGKEPALRPGVSSSPGRGDRLEGEPGPQPTGGQGWRCLPPRCRGGKPVPLNCPPTPTNLGRGADSWVRALRVEMVTAKFRSKGGGLRDGGSAAFNTLSNFSGPLAPALTPEPPCGPWPQQWPS